MAPPPFQPPLPPVEDDDDREDREHLDEAAAAADDKGKVEKTLPQEEQRSNLGMLLRKKRHGAVKAVAPVMKPPRLSRLLGLGKANAENLPTVSSMSQLDDVGEAAPDSHDPARQHVEVGDPNGPDTLEVSGRDKDSDAVTVVDGATRKANDHDDDDNEEETEKENVLGDLATKHVFKRPVGVVRKPNKSRAPLPPEWPTSLPSRKTGPQPMRAAPPPPAASSSGMRHSDQSPAASWTPFSLQQGSSSPATESAKTSGDAATGCATFRFNSTHAALTSLGRHETCVSAARATWAASSNFLNVADFNQSSCMQFRTC